MLPSYFDLKMTSTHLKAFAFAVCAATLLPACGPSAGKSAALDLIGATLPHADGTHYVVENNSAGAASNMTLLSVSWGRLIDEVYDAAGTLVHRDLAIGPDIDSDGLDYQVSTNPISQRTTLTILHNFGTTDYSAAFEALFLGMDDLLPKSLASFELPPYSMVPRNSVIVLRFSDLLDPATVTQDNIRVLSGYTPTTPFSSRMVPDVNFGASVAGTFYSTRVLIDPVVSEMESQATGLPINGLGLPGAINTGSPNLAIRIPTKLDFGVGQFSRLENITSHALNGAGNQPIDYDSPTSDVIRALRTGGPTDKVQDPNNGFLPDGIAPQVVGNQSITIDSIAIDIGAPAGNYLVGLTYANANCSIAAKVGDILTQPGVFAEVTAAGSSPVGGSVSGVKVRLLTTDSGVPFPSGGNYFTTWQPSGPIGADCFVEFDPPAGLGTNVDVDPTASVILRFSEPMDPEWMSTFDAFVVSRQDLALKDMGTRTFVIGEAFPSPDLKLYRFTSRVPMEHSVGATEDFYVHIFEEEGVVDLAGNELANPFPAVPFFMDADAPTYDTDHEAFRFGTFFDQPLGGKVIDDDGNSLADMRGQFVYDSVRGKVKPRPVDRFSQTIDRNVGVPGWMVPNAEVVKNPGQLIGTFQEPLNPLGCKMMTLWRYFDMGLDVVDEAFVNIDVEHVNWAPIGTKVISEYYPDFSISFATSNRTPDETWVAPPNTLIFPNSGFLTASYNENILLDANNPLTTVHQKEEGYFIDPIEKFKSDSQTLMFPYPMNKYRQPDDFLYWTYRDTAITAVGGSDIEIGLEQPVLYDTPLGSLQDPLLPLGAGSSTITVELDENGVPIISDYQISPGLVIPSFGLPILTEFRCYSSDEAIGINRLDTSLAMDPSWTGGGVTGLVFGTNRPFQRIFSSGGADTSGNDVYKDPDLEPIPSGGFNYEPLLAPLGVATGSADNIFYMGQLDFVIRVSRIHTVWHQTAIATPTYAEPVIEPRNENQPAGTSVNLHFRGAIQVAGGVATTDAEQLNMYGNVPASGDPLVFGDPAADNGAITFDTTLGQRWTENLSELNSMRFYQVRMTLINNAAAGTFPELSGLGFAYERL